MADICLLCKKKIGFLGKPGSKTYTERIVCNSCVKELNKALYVYYQNIDGYTFVQLNTVYSHVSELLTHRTKLEEIDAKYSDFIAPVKDKLDLL